MKERDTLDYYCFCFSNIFRLVTFLEKLYGESSNQIPGVLIKI